MNRGAHARRAHVYGHLAFAAKFPQKTRTYVGPTARATSAVTMDGRRSIVSGVRPSTFLLRGLVTLAGFFICIDAFKYTYLGCYIASDSQGSDLVGKDFTFSNLDLPTCVAQCQPAGYPFVGLQFQSTCLCGSSYGRIGYSLFCNCTCGGVYCGGYESNDVYYVVDYSLASLRSFYAYSTPQSFDSARMQCVMENGDLPTVATTSDISNIVTLAAANNISAQTTPNVWIGLYRRLSGFSYEWCDKNANAYTDTDFQTFWTVNDTKELDCVSLNLLTKKFESMSCTDSLPYICNQLAPFTTTTESSDTYTMGDYEATVNEATNRLALYIVLPIFFFCYGGSCILYCAYKIYRNCFQTKQVMIFEPIPSQPIEMIKVQPPMGGPNAGSFKRPLSAGFKKGAVYPMPMDGAGKPMYNPMNDDVQKAIMCGRKPTFKMPGEDALNDPSPPGYNDPRFKGPTAGSTPPGGANQASDGLPTDGANQPGGGNNGAQEPSIPTFVLPGAGAAPTDNGSNLMSITEILKRKMMNQMK